MSNREEKVHEMVKEYYSEITNKKGGELASSVCSCASHCIPDHIKSIAAELPDEIVARYYGCGSPIPDQIEGCTILDLGCGTGRDVYVISKLVGKNGRVIGIDMNDDQLAIAEKYKTEMSQKWGFSNVEFRKGYIEDLKSAGIEDKTIDVVISNCVINLSPDKHSVFSEIWRVLKDNGVLYFSDIFSDRHVPSEINTHPLLLGECLGGAMSHDEFDKIIKDIGWRDYTIVSSHEAPIHNKEIENLVGDIQYTSDTVRAEKVVDSGSTSGKKTKLSIAQPHKKKSCCCGSSGCCGK
jgi:ubiquinone/menaquinone biosynthesis C-methylase UbiE